MMENTTFNNMLTSLLTFFNSYVVPTLLTVAAAVFLVLGIINGIRWAKATTEEEKTKAKKAVLGLIIGAAITVISIWAIPTLIQFLGEVFSSEPLGIQGQ